MATITRDRNDLLDLLREQLNFVNASSKSYDSGLTFEAKRLALHIRVLLHNTNQSHSLLMLLGLISDPIQDGDMKFINTARSHNPNNLLEQGAFNGFLPMLVGNGPVKFVPPLSNVSHREVFQMDFEKWWRDRVVFKDVDGNSYTRRDLVLVVANKYGGAHVDPDIDEKYVKLEKSGALGWEVVKNDMPVSRKINILEPTIRQIAHEVMWSFAQSKRFPEWFGNGQSAEEV